MDNISKAYKSDKKLNQLLTIKAVLVIFWLLSLLITKFSPLVWLVILITGGFALGVVVSLISRRKEAIRKEYLK